MNELPDDLRRALAALDARATKAAAQVDAERVAARVLQRLRSEPAPAATPRHWRTALRVAAAVVVLAAGTVLVRVLTDDRPGAPVATLPLELPESLSTTQATALMDAITAGTDSAAAAPVTLTLDDLNEAELRALLQAMQSETEGAL